MVCYKKLLLLSSAAATTSAAAAPGLFGLAPDMEVPDVSADSPVTELLNACESDIKGINKGFNDFGNKVKSWQGGLIAALPQIPGIVQAGLSLALGGVHSSFLPDPLPVDGLKEIGDLVHRTLAVDNLVVLQNVVDKQPQYDAIGISPFFKLGFTVGKQLHLLFANNILDRVPPEAPEDLVATAHKDIDGITFAFTKAIRAYS